MERRARPVVTHLRPPPGSCPCGTGQVASSPTCRWGCRGVTAPRGPGPTRDIPVGARCGRCDPRVGGGDGAVLSPALLVAVRINGKGREVLYLAKGDSVKLGCPYVLEPEDNGPQGVGIEWIQITPERPGPENVFLSYQDHHVNYGSGSGLQDRVAFVQTDPGQRDASIRVADLQESDTGTYQCRVKKNTVAVHEVIVTVQAEKPAAPQCWSEGELIEGGSVLLRCFSRGGTAPLSYQWAKLAEGYGGGRLPSGTLQGGCRIPLGAREGIWGGLRRGFRGPLPSGTLIWGGSGGVLGGPCKVGAGPLRGGSGGGLGGSGGVLGGPCPRGPCKVREEPPGACGGTRGASGGDWGAPSKGVLWPWGARGDPWLEVHGGWVHMGGGGCVLHVPVCPYPCVPCVRVSMSVCALCPCP
uniref:Uncharacterized protein n=14 Tax=Passeriformes TaxID=9126 RepID=A0A8C3H0R7_CORMO